MTSHATILALADRLGIAPADLLERWSERAAIREYDGGMARDEAEAAAVEDVRELAETKTPTRGTT